MTNDAAPSRSVVLVAVDGSPAAATAIPIARRIAARLGAKVEALHVVQAGTPPAEASARLATAGVKLRLREGQPAQEILRTSEDPRVVLIVLATHGHTVQQQAILERIPRRVAAETTGPVLLVRPEATGSQDVGKPVRRLLFPVDGTPTTTLAFAPATQLAARLGAEMDVLFVVHSNQSIPEERGVMLPPYYVDQPHYEWPAWQARVAQWIRCHCGNLPHDTAIHTFLARAPRGEQIANVIASFAAKRGDDAIVVVRRSHMERGRARIIRALLTCTGCPVLLLAGPPRATRSAEVMQQHAMEEIA